MGILAVTAHVGLDRHATHGVPHDHSIAGIDMGQHGGEVATEPVDVGHPLAPRRGTMAPLVVEHHPVPVAHEASGDRSPQLLGSGPTVDEHHKRRTVGAGGAHGQLGTVRGDHDLVGALGQRKPLRRTGVDGRCAPPPADHGGRPDRDRRGHEHPQDGSEAAAVGPREQHGAERHVHPAATCGSRAAGVTELLNRITPSSTSARRVAR